MYIINMGLTFIQLIILKNRIAKNLFKLGKGNIWHFSIFSHSRYCPFSWQLFGETNRHKFEKSKKHAKTRS